MTEDTYNHVLTELKQDPVVQRLQERVYARLKQNDLLTEWAEAIVNHLVAEAMVNSVREIVQLAQQSQPRDGDQVFHYNEEPQND